MARIERPTVQGPAPVAHQVRSVLVQIEELSTGHLRISTPAARGWAVTVRTEHDLARAVGSAFTEAQVAAYSRWKGDAYDLDELTAALAGDPMAPPRVRPSRRDYPPPGVGYGPGQRRPDTSAPADWVKLEDGRWRSPGGRAYRPETDMVAKVKARRLALGLPI